MRLDVSCSHFACNCFGLKPEELEEETCREGCAEAGSVLFRVQEWMLREGHASPVHGVRGPCPQVPEMPKSGQFKASLSLCPASVIHSGCSAGAATATLLD